MTLNEEITAVEAMVHAARDAASQHLERATTDLHLASEPLAHYKTFLNSTLLSASSLLEHCRELVSLSPAFTEASAGVAPGLLAAVRESLRLMYVAMTVIEQLAGSAQPRELAPTPESAALRSCSFCGKPETEAKLVAGPAANICASCTRLACGVLGIAPPDSKTE